MATVLPGAMPSAFVYDGRCPTLATDRTDAIYAADTIHDTEPFDWGPLHVRLAERESFALVARVDVAGRIQWARRLGGAHARVDAVSDPDASEGVAVVYSDLSSGGPEADYESAGTVVVLRLSPSGQVLWERRFPKPAVSVGLDVRSLAIDDRARVVVAGLTDARLPGLESCSGTRHTAAIAAFGETGDVVWCRAVPAADPPVIAVRHGGALYVVRSELGDGIRSWGSGVVEALRSDGAQEWQHVWTGAFPPEHLALLPDGALIASGEVRAMQGDEQSFIEGVPFHKSPRLGAWLVRLEPDGGNGFVRSFAGGASDAWLHEGLAVDAGGNIWLGVTGGRLELGPVTIPYEHRESALVVFDARGQPKWAQVLSSGDEGMVQSLRTLRSGGVLGTVRFHGRLDLDGAGQGVSSDRYACALMHYPGIPATASLYRAPTTGP